jgi:hypothetical protein
MKIAIPRRILPVLFVLTCALGSAMADSMTLFETYKDNTLGGVYSTTTDTGTFNASLTVPGLSSFTAAAWDNLEVTINAANLVTAADSFGDLEGFSDFMADATNYSGTLSSTSATFYFQLTDTNGNVANAYKMVFSRSGNVLTIAGQTLNPAAVQPPWSILAWYYQAYYQVGSTFSFTNDPVTCEVVLDDEASTNQYADVVRTLYVTGTNTITTDTNGTYLNNIRLAGAADFTAPTNRIVSPVAGQLCSSPLFTIVGTAKDNFAVSNVLYALNGTGWSNAVSTNNWSNWTAPVTLVVGTNTLKSFAVDTAGNYSPTSSVSFAYVVSSQLQLREVGLGKCSPNYSNAWLQIGQSYNLTSTPAAGFKFTDWTVSTNWVGGVTVTSTNLHFVMASNLTLQATLMETSRPALALTAPTTGQHTSNALATVTGTARDNWQMAGVWYQVNNGAWTATATTNGWANWRSTVELVAGTNTIRAYAVNLGGLFSTTNSVSVVSSNTFKLQFTWTNAPTLNASGLKFSLQLSTGLNGAIQVTTNLTSWATLTNFIGTNTVVTFEDPAATNSAERFYRAVVP